VKFNPNGKYPLVEVYSYLGSFLGLYPKPVAAWVRHTTLMEALAFKRLHDEVGSDNNTLRGWFEP
jgi:hypothetical protein